MMKIMIIDVLCVLCVGVSGCAHPFPLPGVDYYEFDKPSRQPALDVDMRGIPVEWDDAQVYISC